MVFQPSGQIALGAEIQQALSQRDQSVTIEPANPLAITFRDLPNRTLELVQNQCQLTRFPAFFPSFFLQGLEVRVSETL